MTARSRGFTLLEMSVAILLLATIAQMVIARLPAPTTIHPADQLLQSARWAAEQAQIERRIYRLQLHSQRWQLSALISGEEGESGPFPETVWHPVNDRHAAGSFDDGSIRLQATSHPLPATLWFMPDGDMTQAALEFVGKNGERRQLNLTPATLFGLPHE